MKLLWLLIIILIFRPTKSTLLFEKLDYCLSSKKTVVFALCELSNQHFSTIVEFVKPVTKLSVRFY